METSLYSPGLGFEVKGEVCGCDLVVLDQGTPATVVIGELKLSFTLEMEALGRRGGEKVGDVFVEEYLRELWERSRAPLMSRSAGAKPSAPPLPRHSFPCSSGSLAAMRRASG